MEKNKVAYTTLKIVKENILGNKEPTYNPITLIGLDKGKSYRFFFPIFDKDFNSQYKSFINYCTIDKLDIEIVCRKKLIILENIHEIVGNKNMQEKLHDLLDICFKSKIQVILCSDENVEKLDINEVLKSKMLYGLKVFVEK